MLSQSLGGPRLKAFRINGGKIQLGQYMAPVRKRVLDNNDANSAQKT